MEHLGLSKEIYVISFILSNILIGLGLHLLNFKEQNIYFRFSNTTLTSLKEFSNHRIILMEQACLMGYKQVPIYS